MRKYIEDDMIGQDSASEQDSVSSKSEDSTINQQTLKDKIPRDDTLCFNRLNWSKRELEERSHPSHPMTPPLRLFIPLGELTNPDKSPPPKKEQLTIPGKGPRESLMGLLKLNKKKPSFANDLPMFEKQETPKKLRNEKNIVSFFATLGRLVRAIKKIKERINYSNIANINLLQFELIDDKSHLADHFDVLNKKPKSLKSLQRSKTQKKVKKTGITLALVGLISKYGRKIKMFHPLNRILILWKALLCLFIIFEIFNISIRLFFHRGWDSKTDYSSVYDFFIKTLMFIDILCVVNTGIFKSGSVIFQRKDALKMYLKHYFILDALALLSLFLPYYENDVEIDSKKISSLPALYVSSLNCLKFLFFLKVHQLSSMYKYLEEILFSEEFYEGLLSLFKLFFQIFFISHLIACAWNFTAAVERINGNNTWYDKIFYEQDPTPVVWKKEYLYSWYWSLTTMITVGYGDISPRNDAEVAIASVAMLFGCGFFAYAISSIGFIVEKFDMKKKNLRKDLRVINKYMTKKEVDFELQVRVRKYLEHLWLEEEIENKDMEVQIMGRLSDSLREELLIQSHGKVLANFSFFTNFFSEETLEKVSQIIKTVSYAPDDIITYDGEPSNNLLYFILKGTVEIYYLNTKTGKSVPMRNLKKGECFGQLSFFTEQERNFHARSRGFTTLYTLNREDFLEIIKKTPEDFENFHLIKDNITLYGDISKLGIKCESCESNQHLFKDCPYIKYSPNHDLLVSKHLHSTPNQRMNFSRKFQQKSSSALLFKAFFSEPEKEADGSQTKEDRNSSSSDESSSSVKTKFSMYEKEGKKSVVFEAHEKIEMDSNEATQKNNSKDINNSQISSNRNAEQKNEDSISVLNFGAKKVLLPRPVGVRKTTIRFEKKIEETSIDEQIIKKSPRKEQITPNEIDLSPGVKNPGIRGSASNHKKETIIASNIRQEFRRDTTTKSNFTNLYHYSSAATINLGNSQNSNNTGNYSNHHVGEPHAFFDKDIPLIFGGLNIDRLQLYSYYYPYNNCICVLEYMKKFSKASIRIKSQNMNSTTKKLGAEAMLEFRNQQRYFLINKEKNKKVKIKPGMSPKRGRSVFKKDGFGFGELLKAI